MTSLEINKLNKGSFAINISRDSVRKFAETNGQNSYILILNFLIEENRKLSKRKYVCKNL